MTLYDTTFHKQSKRLILGEQFLICETNASALSAFSSTRRPDQLLIPDTVFFASQEQSNLCQSETEQKVENDEEQRNYSRQRCNSDSVLRAANPDEIRRGHEQLCIRRAEAVKQRGISLLNEVDAQYSALQVVYS